MFGRRRCCCNPGMGFGMNQGQCGCNPQPIVEPAINKCIEREFCYEVQHICPIHTHVINRHIYNHTYTPQFTCSEENQVVNNDPGCCGGMTNQNF